MCGGDDVTDDLGVEKAMRSDRFDSSPRREARDHSDVLVNVASKSYREFSRWMGHELEKLVARWSHVAAPSVSRKPRFRFRLAKPK